MEFLFFITFVYLFSFSADKFEKIVDIPLTKTPVAISADVYRQVYVAESKGVIRQYDSTGKQLAYYSPNQLAEVTALEARFGVRVYAFYQDLQSFTVFDRFLQPLRNYHLPTEKIGFAQTIAWGADQNVWIWDSQNMTIKRYNPIAEEVFLEVSLSQIIPKAYKQIELLRMQEYENRLYIFDKKQVFVLDYLGNLLNILPASAISYLDAEKLWSCVGKDLYSTAIYENEKKNVIPFLEVPENILFLYIHTDKIWTFESKKITLWRLKPE